MLSYTEWESDCGYIQYVNGSVNGIHQLPSHIENACLVVPPPPHDHKMPKYKLSKLHYRSHGVGAGFWGTKGQEKAGSPCEGCIFVKRWVTVNIWICTIKTVTRENWTFIQFWEICLLLLRYEVSYWQWFPEACQDQLPSSLGIPVVFSFPEDDEREEEEEGEAAALHRDVWDSSCNPWPLPQRQVSYLVI